jgi:hypothetical protein
MRWKGRQGREDGKEAVLRMFGAEMTILDSQW